MFTSLFSLASFNEIFSLAVGLNLAYILVNKSQKKENSFSLFSFVSGIVSELALKAIAIKTEELTRVTKLIALGQGYLDSGLLKSNTKAVIEHNNAGALKIKQKIDELNADVRKRISNDNCIRTVNMPYLAFDCSIYGLLLIFASAFENDLGIDVHPFVSVFNICVIILSVYCAVFENHPTDKWYKPSMWNQILLLFVFAFIGLVYPRRFVFIHSIFWENFTYCLAVLLSMSSLIAYLIGCYHNCRKEYRTSMDILNHQSFSSEIYFREKELNSFKSELIIIEKDLKKDIELEIVQSPKEASHS